MAIEREYRASDSDLVQWITRGTYVASTAPDLTVPDGCWDFVFWLRRAKSVVLQTGMVTHPTLLHAEPGDSYVGIAFRTDVFMPRRPGCEMVNGAIVRRSTGRSATCIEGERFEIPTSVLAHRTHEAVSTSPPFPSRHLSHGTVQSRLRY